MRCGRATGTSRISGSRSSSRCRSRGAKGAASGFAIYFEVEDVDARYEELTANGRNRNLTPDPFPRGKGNRNKGARDGVKIVHEPKKTAWGYGPELRDPDRYIVRLFDHRSITK